MIRSSVWSHSWPTLDFFLFSLHTRRNVHRPWYSPRWTCEPICVLILSPDYVTRALVHVVSCGGQTRRPVLTSALAWKVARMPLAFVFFIQLWRWKPEYASQTTTWHSGSCVTVTVPRTFPTLFIQWDCAAHGIRGNDSINWWTRLQDGWRCLPYSTTMHTRTLTAYSWSLAFATIGRRRL